MSRKNIELLGLMFIGLKIVGIINWPWFWVLSPIIISFILFVGIFVYSYYKQKKEDQ